LLCITKTQPANAHRCPATLRKRLGPLPLGVWLSGIAFLRALPASPIWSPDRTLSTKCGNRLSLAALVTAAILFLGAGSAHSQQGLGLRSSSHVAIPPMSSGNQTMELSTRPHLALDVTLSGKATNYLHVHRLPFVQAEVGRDVSGTPASVALTGKVRTLRGKEDAERRTQDLLGATIVINNQIQIDPNLSVTLTRQSFDSRVIPQKLFGCWRQQGTSPASESVEYLGGCPRANVLPQTKDLCFVKTEIAPGYQITYQSERANLHNFDAHIDVASSDGDRHIDLVEMVSFDDRLLFSVFYINGRETLSCDLTGDSDLMCEASMLQTCNGTPWYRISGAAPLHRVR